jgi:hypothetical protein
MRVAADGKPFDVDHHPDEELGPDAVEVIQFLLPDGRRRRMRAPVGEVTARLGREMVLTARLGLGTRAVVLGARFADEPEALVIRAPAVNGPGPCSPCNVLTTLIRTAHARRS